MNWRLQSLLLGVVVFVIVSTLPVHGFQPSKLKAPSKNDFEVFSASMSNDSPVEEWLCPYAYRPVTLDQRNPVLVELLGNFSRLFDAQFNFSQYGTLNNNILYILHRVFHTRICCVKSAIALSLNLRTFLSQF
jgi:hypothetical protein